MPANKLEDLLSPCKDGGLGNLVDRAQRMGELTHVLCAALPESDRVGVVAANLRDDGELVVVCASSAWASKLRYEGDRLLEAARQSGANATQFRVRVSQG